MKQEYALCRIRRRCLTRRYQNGPQHLVAALEYRHPGTTPMAEDFLTAFLLENGCAYFGRPTGLAVARDGALLISDDTSGVIYRVAYSTEAARR